jgi:hypothetical protein
MFPTAATAARDRRVVIGAMGLQRSLRGLYTSHSEWMAKREPPPTAKR